MRIVYLTLALGLFFSFSACKKEVNPTTGGDPVDPVDPREVYLDNEHENKVRDSIWYYYKVLSLWESYVPPRNTNDIEKAGYIRNEYTKYYETGEDVLDYLMDLTKAPGTESTKNYDWYSFLDRAGEVSGEIQDAVATSYGMYVFYLQTETSGNNAYLYVRMVDKNSSAYKAGIRRGDMILGINGDTKIDYDSQAAQNFRGINTYLSSQSMKVRFAKPDGTITEKDIASVQYKMDPVMDSRVFDRDGKKVGYLAFSSFVNVLEAKNGMKATFDGIFSDFESKGINELIVDLRYNGGGAVVTAEYLADRIVPTSADKDLMYKYEVNDLLKSWDWLEEGEGFAPVYFNKTGALNLSRVYFLVTNSTASASELLINSLTPHMQVYMVGTNSVNNQNQVVGNNTYGKPVGFFGLPIVDDDIELYVTSFKTLNKKGEGDYFNGLEPNAHVWEFSDFRDFGDDEEPMIASALNHIQNGTFATAASRVAIASNGRISTKRPKAVSVLQENRLNNGMYKFFKRHLQK